MFCLFVVVCCCLFVFCMGFFLVVAFFFLSWYVGLPVCRSLYPYTPGERDVAP